MLDSLKRLKAQLPQTKKSLFSSANPEEKTTRELHAELAKLPRPEQAPRITTATRVLGNGLRPSDTPNGKGLQDPSIAVGGHVIDWLNLSKELVNCTTDKPFVKLEQLLSMAEWFEAMGTHYRDIIKTFPEHAQNIKDFQIKLAKRAELEDLINHQKSHDARVDVDAVATVAMHEEAESTFKAQQKQLDQQSKIIDELRKELLAQKETK
ncbi:hypothetical protein AB4304_13980 [Vibrio breoganii]